MKDDDTPDSDDYEVGYGKTPLHTRFQKGVSGNPKGRPKGVRNFQTELREELSSKITIQENGKRKRITKRRAVAKQITTKAANGDLKAIPLLLNQSQDLVSEREQLAAVFDTPDDRSVLSGLLDRFREATQDAPPQPDQPEDEAP
jgi:Family of unknown function (DUF5681)